VVSGPALQRRMIRGWSPRRLRHHHFQPTPRRDLDWRRADTNARIRSGRRLGAVRWRPSPHPYPAAQRTRRL